jgi:phosphoglucosamine mutase
MRLFGTDGVRGVAGQGLLAPTSVTRLAKAAAYLLKTRAGQFREGALSRRVRTAKRSNVFGRNRVLIGRDTRVSGPAIEEILCAEFLAMGFGVLRGGILPTSAVAYLAREWGVSAGVVISASHNPPEDNGIKLLSPDGLKIPDEAEEGIERLYSDRDFDPHLSYAVRPKSATREDVQERAAAEYVDFLAGGIPEPKLLLGKRVVVDLAHGAATSCAPTAFHRLGLHPIFLHSEPAGDRINVGCGATNLGPLTEAVRREGADLGIAFDGDQDRALFVDERGAVVDGDRVLSIFAEWLRSKGRLTGNVIVGTQMTNWGLEQFCQQNGIRLVRAHVGDRFVAATMLREGAVLGGEPSGHTILLDRLPTGDGMVTALQLLQIMGETGSSLSRLSAAMTPSPQVLISVPVASKPPLDEVDRVEAAIRRAKEQLDQEGRILVRYSGTEDLCRVMVEGRDARLVDRVARQVSEAIREEIGR